MRACSIPSAANLPPVKVVVLTGAGISAESGLPTFRDADGLWEGHDPMDVATPGGVRGGPGPGAALLRRAPRAAGGGRTQRGPPRAGAARGAPGRGPLPRHPEHRRPARARRLQARAPHARPAAQRVVHQLRPAARVDRDPGRPATVPDVRHGHPATGRRVVRRDPHDMERSTRRCSTASCSSRSGPRGRLPGGCVRALRHRRRRAHARPEPRPADGERLRRGTTRALRPRPSRPGWRRCCDAESAVVVAPAARGGVWRQRGGELEARRALRASWSRRRPTRSWRRRTLR